MKKEFAELTKPIECPKLSDFKSRQEKILAQMEPQSIAIIHSGDQKQRSWDQKYPFTPNRNFLYLTGLDLPRCILLLHKKHDGTGETLLFIERPNAHSQLHFGEMKDADYYGAATGISTCDYTDRFDFMLQRLLTRTLNIYFDIDGYGAFEGGYTQTLAASIRSALPHLQFKNIAPIIARLRRFKSEDEITSIRRAIEITKLGIDSIRENLKPGLMEYQLEAHFDFALRYNGAQGTAFDTIMAGGANSCIIHYGSNNCELKKGDVLLMDLGAQYNYYAADISRTFPVEGTFTPKQLYFYEAVLETQLHIIENCLKPGFVHEKTWDEANKILSKWLIKSGEMQSESEIRRYLPHGICHFLGLDTHDVGEFDLLEPGMVITCEPGVYLPQYGFGIRIEDDILITQNGCEVLSADIAKWPHEIMRG